MILHPGRSVALVVLLAGALLACHGLLGASHVLAGVSAQQPAPAGPVSEAPLAPGHATMAHHAEGGSSDPSATPAVGPAEYFAVLLALAGVALLLASFGSGRISPFRSVSRATVLRDARAQPLPRGISPPFSQVFRL